MTYKKKKLFTPGPTEIPKIVFMAMSEIEHHRTSQFEKKVQEIQKGLQYIFQTTQPVISLVSTGTGAMEAAITNLFSPGEKVLVIDGGKFGERWAEISKTYGLEVITLKVPWGQALKMDEFKKSFSEHNDIAGVLVQASETSTGVAHPIYDMARFLQDKKTQRVDTLFVVDAISALVTMNLPFDEWKIDAMVAGSQKGFMLPPGLSFIALSQKAWDKAASSKLPKYYFDLIKEKACLEKNTTAYTTAVTLMLGLKKALELLKEEGLENIFKRYARFSQATQTCIQEWGLEVFPEIGAPGMVAVVSPQNVKSSTIVKALREKFDMTIAAGQAEMKDKIFRISYMGDIDASDILYLLKSLEKVLQELNIPINTTRALKKAQKILNS